MDKTQLQWLLAVVGAAVVVLIYLWGIRSRLKEEIRNRRRRSSLTNEPKWDETATDLPEEGEPIHEFGDLGRVTPDHHLADKILVDVEIHPISRDVEPRLDHEPTAKRLPPLIKPSLEKPIKSPTRRRPPLQEPPAIAPPTTQAAGIEQPFEETPPAAISEPTIDIENPVMQMKATDSSPESAATLSPEPTPSSESKTMVAITVMAPRQRPFKGLDIQAAAEEAGLQLAASGLFERYPTLDIGANNSVFSLAHLRKPGLFETHTLAQLSTPGLLFFMSLPGPLDGAKALDLLVLTADRVARKLNGVICNEQGQRMTNQGLLALRDKVIKLGATAH